MGTDVSQILFKKKTFALPQKRGFIKNPKTIGEHIRKKRMQVGLFQNDVARLLNVTADCVTYWENNRSTPQINYYPRIISFLGYNPFKINTNTLSGKIFAYRCIHGLSAKKVENHINFKLWSENYAFM